MLMVPFLFMAGVAFGYFVALPRAVDFLQNFNDQSFDILLQATDYYRFSVVLLAVIGLLFQIPVGVLAVTRLGVVTARQLAQNRGYVILAIAVVAAVATPTPDPVTMLIAMAPLVVLFELSVSLARFFERRASEGRAEDGRGTRGRRPGRRSGPILRDHALRPSRPRPPPHRAGHLPGLAILMGGGLVLFGIGGATSGGLFDASRATSSTTSGDRRVPEARRRAREAHEPTRRTRPRGRGSPALRFQSPAAAHTTRRRAHTPTRARAPPGRGGLAALPRARTRRSPTTTVASQMVQAYGPTGLNSTTRRSAAQESSSTRRHRPAALYAQLAIFAYGAGQTRKATSPATRRSP